MIRVMFKATEYPLRFPQEIAFMYPQASWDPVTQEVIPPVSTPEQYVDVLATEIPEDVPIVGVVLEPGVWELEPPFDLPHHFGVWEPRDEELV